MERIVVGYDGSEHGQRALERAAMIAKAMGARLSIVSSAKISQLMRDPGGGASPVDPAEAEAREKALTAAREYIAGQGMEADFVEGHGSPADVLLQEAEATNAELIVVGTRGLNVAQRLLLGSVSTNILHHAPCDVLVVR
jgi:nucleotide-binding universal stress UspA family protein